MNGSGVQYLVGPSTNYRHTLRNTAALIAHLTRISTLGAHPVGLFDLCFITIITLSPGVAFVQFSCFSSAN